MQSDAVRRSADVGHTKTDCMYIKSFRIYLLGIYWNFIHSPSIVQKPLSIIIYQLIFCWFDQVRTITTKYTWESLRLTRRPYNRKQTRTSIHGSEVYKFSLDTKGKRVSWPVQKLSEQPAIHTSLVYVIDNVIGIVDCCTSSTQRQTRWSREQFSLYPVLPALPLPIRHHNIVMFCSIHHLTNIPTACEYRSM
jgi:hypothetical protein